MGNKTIGIILTFAILSTVAAQIDAPIQPSSEQKTPKKTPPKSPKPLFPNLFLRPVEPFYGQGQGQGQGQGPVTPEGHDHTHEHGPSEFLSPCFYPAPQNQIQPPPYPPGQGQGQDHEGQGQQPLPPIPELFQKSTTTEKSIFGKPRSTTERTTDTTPNDEETKATTKKASIFDRRRSTTQSTTTTTQDSSSEEDFSPPPQKTTTQKPSRAKMQRTTAKPPPKRMKTPQTTTTRPPTSTKPTTKEPTQVTRTSQRGGRKLNFKGLPEPPQNPLYAYPQIYEQEPGRVRVEDPQSLDDPQPQDASPYLTPPSIKYKIAIVADLGKDAKISDGRFQSFLKEGSIYVQKSSEDPTKYNVTIELNSAEDPYVIESNYNNNNEGFELSTLNVFDGKLYSCDDETGIIYELTKIPVEIPPSNRLRKLRPGRMRRLNIKRPRNATYVAKPWIILTNDDDGSGFRCEWATVKDESLWIGSTGILVKKSENDPEFDRSRQIVKKVSPGGIIQSLNWARNYEKLSESVGLPFDKGFAVHEAVAWSDQLQRWLFTPRRISKIKQEEKLFHKKGGNMAVFVDNDFENFQTAQLGELVVTAGFTSIKFIPGTDDTLILALKAGLDTQTSELMSTLEVFDINGEGITPEISVGKGIYAGVEFI